MSQPKSNACTCAPLLEAPRTVSDLSATEHVEFLDGDLESIALLGTQLSEAVITSNNGAALATGMGGLASLQSTAHPFRLSERRMTFRFNSAEPVQLLSVTGRAGPQTGLAVSNITGDLSLRVETNGGYDTSVICALDCIAKPANSKSTTPSGVHTDLPENVVPLTAIRSARSTWLQGDSGSHLNDLCIGGGVIRSATLPHIGRHKAWRVTNEVLPSFLTYLLDHKIGFAPLVAGCGFVFGSLFKQGTAQKLDSVYWIANGPQNFALDMEHVGAAWLTMCGLALHLELYDKAGRALAVLVPDRNLDLQHWNTLLTSLPEVRSVLQRSRST